MSPKVWLITGTSSGFGSLLTKAALKRGDKVIATARNPRKIEDLKLLGAATLALDVIDDEQIINKAITDAIAIYGRIDILVNNAGYILEGGAEESSGDEVFKQFDTNVFGPMKVIRAVLPHMRERRSGVVANMGSIGGWRGGVGVSMYCATKFALAGITEALRLELLPLGIDAVVIEPGYFRTNFLSPGHRVSVATRIPDYDQVIEPIRKMFNAYDFKQPGDPEKGAQAIVEILTKSGRVAGMTIPARVPLGSDTLTLIAAKCHETLENLDNWKEVAGSTNHDDVAI